MPTMAETTESVAAAELQIAPESTNIVSGSEAVESSTVAVEPTPVVENPAPAQSSTAIDPTPIDGSSAAAENVAVRDSLGSFLATENAAAAQMAHEIAAAQLENPDLAVAGMEEKDTVDAHIVNEAATAIDALKGEQKVSEAATETKEEPGVEATETPIKRARMSFSKMPILACVKIYHPRPASLPLDDENANVRLLGRVASVPRPSKGIHHFTLQWTKQAKEKYEEMYVDDSDFYDEEDRRKAQIVTKCEGNDRNKRLLRDALTEADKLSQEELRAALYEMDESYGKRLKQQSPRPPGRPRKSTTPKKSPPKKKAAKPAKKETKKAATPTRKRGRPRKVVVEQEDEEDDDTEYEQDDSEEEEEPTPRKRGRPRKNAPKKATPKKRVAAKKKAVGRKKVTAKKGKATLTKAGARSKKKAVPPSARKKRASSK